MLTVSWHAPLFLHPYSFFVSKTGCDGWKWNCHLAPHYHKKVQDNHWDPPQAAALCAHLWRGKWEEENNCLAKCRDLVFYVQLNANPSDTGLPLINSCTTSCINKHFLHLYMHATRRKQMWITGGSATPNWGAHCWGTLLTVNCDINNSHWILMVPFLTASGLLTNEEALLAVHPLHLLLLV